MRTFLTLIDPPGAQPRCARTRSNSRMSRDNQCANVTRQSMRAPRAASDAQPSESMRTFLASINPPGAQPRCARARSKIRMSPENESARIAPQQILSTIRINAHIPRVNRPSRGATSLRTRALQFVNVTRQSMRGHRAASDAQPSESMRTFLTSIAPPRAQPRCARARSNSRMSRDNQCARLHRA